MGLPAGDSPAGITIRSEPEGSSAAEIESRLARDIASRFGPADPERVVLVAERGGHFFGGITGLVHWKWLYIRQLWVEERERGRGAGRALVERAIVEAVARDCAGVYVDTFDPRTAAFYARSGFGEVGRIAGFPPGHTRIFLALELTLSGGTRQNRLETEPLCRPVKDI